ncbi:hypothetical protein LCGC14_1377230 [marine sediment metagenome]|uniref:Uncharacterized protein n=1 Tax=marine sediment metagenome TaxID=412755 RepID=A0A0F9K421_9ZZZZ
MCSEVRHGKEIYKMKNKTTKQEIDGMIKDNMFEEEDRKLATFVLDLFKQSPEKMRTKKDISCQKWFKELRKNNIITKDMKISVDKDFEEHSGIEFIMIMMCAKGLIKRV